MCTENNLLVTASYCWLLFLVLFYYFHQWKYTKINYVRDQDTQMVVPWMESGYWKMCWIESVLKGPISTALFSQMRKPRPGMATFTTIPGKDKSLPLSQLCLWVMHWCKLSHKQKPASLTTVVGREALMKTEPGRKGGRGLQWMRRIKVTSNGSSLGTWKSEDQNGEVMREVALMRRRMWVSFWMLSVLRHIPVGPTYGQSQIQTKR